MDGGWSGWSEFSKCDAKCGNGTKMLKRSCTNPSPENGGQLCQGRRIKVVPCQDICQGKDVEYVWFQTMLSFYTVPPHDKSHLTF